MSTLSSLRPTLIWKYFEEILTIPRPSGQESLIRNYLIDFAKQHDLAYKVDQTGNLLICKKASQGKEKVPVIILQSHLDMVCEKNSETKHDFLKDPITAYIDDTWVKASGTTLGADDGIGIAAQMAILASDDISHGPIECLFTVEEETGLTGAFGLEPGFLTGTTLLNLDSEDEGELFIGCAGGRDTTITFSFKREPVPVDYQAYKLTVSGLKGGHSGDDIHRGLGNANKILNRFLWNEQSHLRLRVADFNGGNLRNAIPREASAIVLVPSKYEKELLNSLIKYEQVMRNEFSLTEPGLALKINRCENPDYTIDLLSQEKLINALYATPHGVHSWSQSMAGMVESSTNLASVKFSEESAFITTSQRSSLDSSKEDIVNMVTSVWRLTDAKIEHSNGYPGWSPNPDSQILKTTVDAYIRLFGSPPIVRSIHAGLECGLFLEKYPHLDMVSFGPTIKGAHSPDERLDIATTGKFWNLLVEVITNFS